MMPLLDTLEARFNRIIERKPLSPSGGRLRSFVKRLSPGLPDLAATECYSLSRFLRDVLTPAAWLSLFYYVFLLVLLVWFGIHIWHTFPVLFHPGRKQARFWHGVWQSMRPVLIKKGFFLIMFVPLTWTLSSLIILLPHMYFWNRRARRLQCVGEVASIREIAEAAAPDTSVWPPPPRLD